MEEIARVLVLFGIVLIIIGGLVFLLSRVPLFGRLPGDISIQTQGISCFIPLASSILLSLILTLILNLVLRIINQ